MSETRTKFLELNTFIHTAREHVLQLEQALLRGKTSLVRAEAERDQLITDALFDRRELSDDQADRVLRDAGESLGRSIEIADGDRLSNRITIPVVQFSRHKPHERALADMKTPFGGEFIRRWNALPNDVSRLSDVTFNAIAAQAAQAAGLLYTDAERTIAMRILAHQNCRCPMDPGKDFDVKALQDLANPDQFDTDAQHAA